MIKHIPTCQHSSNTIRATVPVTPSPTCKHREKKVSWKNEDEYINEKITNKISNGHINQTIKSIYKRPRKETPKYKTTVIEPSANGRVWKYDYNDVSYSSDISQEGPF